MAAPVASEWTWPTDLPGTFEQDTNDDQCHSTSARMDNDRSSPRDRTHHTHASDTQGKSSSRRRTYPPRQCRICLETVQPTFQTDVDSSLPAGLQSTPRVIYESEDGGRLLSPCKCKGSQKYVHEDCLGAWRRADPLQKRNYWECPTCHYRYHLQRLAWSHWISSTAAQLGLTLAIFVLTIFVLGFFADPIINMYLDPVNTIATAGGPTGSFIYEDETVTWTEHFAKGLASLGLLGFVKFLFSLSPLQWFRTGGFISRSNVGGSGRDRLQQLSWITIIVGLATFLYAVWTGVRAYVRKTLEAAGERVLDVSGVDDDDDDDGTAEG